MFKLNWINLSTACDDADGGLSCVLSVILGNDSKISWVDCLQLLFGNFDFMLQVHTLNIDILHLFSDELAGEAGRSSFKLSLNCLCSL